jgi:hypothetical protein
MRTMKALWSQLGSVWCSMSHPAPMWPIHGRYQCRTCFRVYPVQWERYEPPAPRDLTVAALPANAAEAEALAL